MIRNFLVLFVRNILRQRLFSAINLLGLTVSMASTLIIYLYVHEEFSFDRFHPYADRVFRVNQTFIWGQSDQHQFGSVGPGVGHALLEELPEIELMTRLTTQGDYVGILVNNAGDVKSFEEKKVLIADSNFFRMFRFPLIEGNPETALRHANTLVLTESTARRYFGVAPAIGRQIELGSGKEKRSYEVTGIVDDPPGNTYFQFDMLMSLESFPVVRRLSWSWVWTQLETYVRFQEGTDIDQTLGRMAGIPRKHADETLRRAMGTTYEEFIQAGKKWELFLQPMTSLHLPDVPTYNRVSTPGNKKIVYALIVAGAFILLLSCVNFVNLSTAQFLRRIKEASIRKILGIGRRQLGIQYLMEAVFYCLIALALASALTQMLLPAFNSLTGKSLGLHLFSDPLLLAAIGVMVVLMTLLSSSYPAFFLSSFHPIDGMKGKVKSGTEGKHIRNGLVVFQFTASIALVVCTAVIFEQLRFMSEKDLGFDKENLLVLSLVESSNSGETLVNAIKQVPGIKEATLCTSIPPYLWGGDSFTSSELGGKKFQLNFTTADASFVPTLGLKLRIGRNFSLENLADSNRVLLNVTAIQSIGWPMDETIIGKKFESPGDDRKFEVIGVIEDFNYWPLQAVIQPMAIFHIRSAEVVGEGQKEFAGIRVQASTREDWNVLLRDLEKLWKEHAGAIPFQYSFVDESFADAFRTEEKFANGLGVLAGLSVLIACLGLLGIVVYALELRTKEIGIRKVSGASTWQILRLIAGSYVNLILIAFLIASAVSYWVMDRWLTSFTHRITLSPGLFVATGLGTLGVAMLIASYHALKAATLNPVEVLKDE